MSEFQPILTEYIKDNNCHSLSFYQNKGGYTALKQVLKMKPEDVIEEVKSSNLRGRGGAGFSAGLKWTFIPKDTAKPKYLINNADESEPGTFKDRLLINKAPHQMLEGMIIASYAINCNTAFIYIRGEFYKEYQQLKNTIIEAYEAIIIPSSI